MEPNQQNPLDAPTPNEQPTPEQPIVPTTPDVPDQDPNQPPVDVQLQPESPAAQAILDPLTIEQPIEQSKLDQIADQPPAQPATPPPTPTFPTPMPDQPIVPMGAPIPTGQPKSKKGLIIGLIAGIGGLLIIGGVVLVLVLFVFGGKISSVAGLKDAIKNRKAVNCTFTDGGQTATLQANDSWSKVRMKASGSNVLMIEGDAMYSWSGSMGYKAPYDKSMIDSLTDGASWEDSGGSSVTGLKCESNSAADFAVPSDIKFTDSSN